MIFVLAMLTIHLCIVDTPLKASAVNENNFVFLVIFYFQLLLKLSFNAHNFFTTLHC